MANFDKNTVAELKQMIKKRGGNAVSTKKSELIAQLNKLMNKQRSTSPVVAKRARVDSNASSATIKSVASARSVTPVNKAAVKVVAKPAVSPSKAQVSGQRVASPIVKKAPASLVKAVLPLSPKIGASLVKPQAIASPRAASPVHQGFNKASPLTHSHSHTHSHSPSHTHTHAHSPSHAHSHSYLVNKVASPVMKAISPVLSRSQSPASKPTCAKTSNGWTCNGVPCSPKSASNWTCVNTPKGKTYINLSPRSSPVKPASNWVCVNTPKGKAYVRTGSVSPRATSPVNTQQRALSPKVFSPASRPVMTTMSPISRPTLINSPRMLSPVARPIQAQMQAPKPLSAMNSPRTMSPMGQSNLKSFVAPPMRTMSPITRTISQSPAKVTVQANHKSVAMNQTVNKPVQFTAAKQAQAHRW